LMNFGISSMVELVTLTSVTSGAGHTDQC
jgi:hypothetical protein